MAALAEFDIAALDQIPELIERTIQAEALWKDQQVERKGFALRKARDEAIALRYQLVSAARHFLRSPALLRRFEGLNRRRTIASIVSDLLRLADLVEEHPEIASAPGLPENPVEVAHQLEERLVGGNVRSSYFQAEGDRNALIVLLSLAVQEVGSAARFLFRHEPELLDRLADQELRKSKKQRRKARSLTAREPSPDANG